VIHKRTVVLIIKGNNLFIKMDNPQETKII
jgi:hypothetical protein